MENWFIRDDITGKDLKAHIKTLIESTQQTTLKEVKEKIFIITDQYQDEKIGYAKMCELIENLLTNTNN